MGNERMRWLIPSRSILTTTGSSFLSLSLSLSLSSLGDLSLSAALSLALLLSFLSLSFSFSLESALDLSFSSAFFSSFDFSSSLSGARGDFSSLFSTAIYTLRETRCSSLDMSRPARPDLFRDEHPVSRRGYIEIGRAHGSTPVTTLY